MFVNISYVYSLGKVILFIAVKKLILKMFCALVIHLIFSRGVRINWSCKLVLMQSGSLKCRGKFMLCTQILIRIPCSVRSENFLWVLKAFSLLASLVFHSVGLLYIMNRRNDTVRNPPAEIILRNFLLDLYAVLIFNNNCSQNAPLYAVMSINNQNE